MKRYRNSLLQARNSTRTRGHALRFYRAKWLHPLRVVVPDVSQKPQADIVADDRQGYSPYQQDSDSGAGEGVGDSIELINPWASYDSARWKDSCKAFLGCGICQAWL